MTFTLQLVVAEAMTEVGASMRGVVTVEPASHAKELNGQSDLGH